MNNDLISRSALVDALYETEFQTHVPLDEVDTVIDSMPAVDAEPVRHGMWESVTVSSGRDSWKCSECGRRARGKRKNLPYCHCGAKMDWEGIK